MDASEALVTKSPDQLWSRQRRYLRLRSAINTASVAIIVVPLIAYFITFTLAYHTVAPHIFTPLSSNQTDIATSSSINTAATRTDNAAVVVHKSSSVSVITHANNAPVDSTGVISIAVESIAVESLTVSRSGIVLPPEVQSHRHQYRMEDVTVSTTSTSPKDYALNYTIASASPTLDCHEFYRGKPHFIGFEEDPNGSKACRSTAQFRSGSWKCMEPTDTSFPWRPSYRVGQPFIVYTNETVMTDYTGRFATLDQNHRWHIAASCWYSTSPWDHQNVNVNNLKHYPTAIMLSQKASENYFHFVVESLPRLTILPKHIRNDPNIPILFVEPIYPSMAEFFQCLGLIDRVVWMKRSDVVLIDQMILPMAGQCKEPNPIMLLQHRKTFFEDSCLAPELGPVTAHAHRDGVIRNILWMVRGGRQLKNNDELFERIRLAFPQANITLHYGTFTLNQTAKAFYNADMIIGPHGAGFSNILFARVGTIVVEMIAEGYPNYIGFHLSEIYGLQYYLLVSRGGSDMSELLIQTNEFDHLLTKIQSDMEVNARVRLLNMTQWNITCDTTKDLRKLF